MTSPLRLIAITSPRFLPDEGERIAVLLAEGNFWRVHVRKPEASADDLRRLLSTIPAWCYPRLVLHDHHELCGEYCVGGLHLNRRNPDAPKFARSSGLSLSYSCHSLSEVELRKSKMNYVFLSPIFDSISKRGYRSKFSLSELQKAAAEGIIDSKVVALGGITKDNLPLLQSLHFGGAAMLGAIWE